MSRSTLKILPAFGDRYSPRSFQQRDVSDTELELLLEAARWTPSSMNEQPWRFLVTRREGEGHAALFATLSAGNQRWAGAAPLLILCMAVRTFARNDHENFHARHDLGMAVAQLNAQATALGMGMHILGGFNAVATRAAFELPDELDLVSVLAIGFPGDPAQLPDDLRAREENHSPRRPLQEIARTGRWSGPV